MESSVASLSRIQPNRNWSIIHSFDLHMLAKSTHRDGTLEFHSELAEEFFKHLVAIDWSSRTVERRTGALLQVAEQGKLTDQQDPLVTGQRFIHFSLGIIKNPHPKKFFENPTYIIGLISRFYAQIDQETFANLTNHLFVYANGGMRNSADETPQGETDGSSSRAAHFIINGLQRFYS